MKMKILLLLTFGLSVTLLAKEGVYPLSDNIQYVMKKAGSWKKGCPVALKDLRYLRLKYLDFEGQTREGEMIVHKAVADEVVDMFNELYNIHYPIHKMKIVSTYKGNDWLSIENDNTSAFNCRHATGSKKWSKHSYGKAIDINPIENPYVFKSGKSSHKASAKYLRRKSNHPAVILKNGRVIKIFKKYGWKWGGDWQGARDYQHFWY